MKLNLSSVGNPDFRQDPTKPLFGAEKNKLIPISSFKEAKEKCMQFIDDNDLGSGNWEGGQIFDENNNLIAEVSYNGRIWKAVDGKFSWTPNSEEIKI